jgi:hypothetical protein
MRLFTALMALIAATALLPSTAEAQTRRCLVTAQSAPALVTYDPFNPSSLTINSLAITFTRANGPGGAKPSTIDMYIQAQTSAANGTTLTPVSVVGAGSATGLNQNIFYNNPGTVPNITIPLGGSPVPGVLRWDYSGNNAASDVFTVTFNVVLPANLNVDSSTSINFDIHYGCNGTGGGPPFSELSTAPNAFTLQIHVKSGLQASFVGPALAFGEVGDKTDTDVTSAPATYTRTGNIRVASSGPYTIDMTSQNGYRMTYSGGTPATEVQNLRYENTFLGQVRNPSNTAAINQTCTRAGLGSPPLSGGVLLPVSVRLLEGGTDEVPSALYQDNLIVTLTPLVALGQGVTCP